MTRPSLRTVRAVLAKPQVRPHTALQSVVSSSGLARSSSLHMVTQSQMGKFSIWLVTICPLRHRYPVPPTYAPDIKRYLPAPLAHGKLSLFSLSRHYYCFVHILTLSVLHISTHPHILRSCGYSAPHFSGHLHFGLSTRGLASFLSADFSHPRHTVSSVPLALACYSDPSLLRWL